MKKAIFLPLFLFLALPPAQISAQTYSADQQAVIDQLERCFQNFWQAMSKSDFSVFEDACPCDEDFAVWNLSFGAPVGIEAVKDLFEQGVAAGPTPPIIILRPVRVKIAGDFAIAYYYVDTYQVDYDDLFLNFNAGMRMTVLRRVNRRWQLAGDMVAPLEKE